MQKVSSGKVVFVNGPSFGGKTFLISQLIQDLPFIQNVNFELIYKKHSKRLIAYNEFYETVHTKSLNGPVIAESVDDMSPFTKHGIMISPLIIHVVPEIKTYLERIRKYTEIFGSQATSIRTGGLDPKRLHSQFVFNTKVSSRIDPKVVFNGENYHEVLEAVKEYVMDNGPHINTEKQ